MNLLDVWVVTHRTAIETGTTYVDSKEVIGIAATPEAGARMIAEHVKSYAGSKPTVWKSENFWTIEYSRDEWEPNFEIHRYEVQE